MVGVLSRCCIPDVGCAQALEKWGGVYTMQASQELLCASPQPTQATHPALGGSEHQIGVTTLQRGVQQSRVAMR